MEVEHQRPTGADEGILYGDPVRRMLPTLVHPNEIGRLWFAGVVLTVAHATEPERVRSAAMAAGLVADVLGADGAIFTKIGGGAPHVDMAQAAAACEARGVKTALLVEDMSTDGSEEGMLLFNFPGLDALVNVGSAQEKVALSPMARAIGAADAVDMTVSTCGAICGAIEQVGASRVMSEVQ